MSFTQYIHAIAESRESSGLLQSIQPIIEENRDRPHGLPLSQPSPSLTDLGSDDAFSTIMAWLYSRIAIGGTHIDSS